MLFLVAGVLSGCSTLPRTCDQIGKRNILVPSDALRAQVFEQLQHLLIQDSDACWYAETDGKIEISNRAYGLAIELNGESWEVSEEWIVIEAARSNSL